jgi:hypothetical protein
MHRGRYAGRIIIGDFQEGAAMLTCTLNLRPLNWHQSVEHYTGINIEGRRFGANCTVGPGSNLRLSNEMRLDELPVEILIFETTRMQDELAKLPQGALGSFSFYDATPADDYPSMDAFLSGWFVLNGQSLQDAWDQVQQGGYGECTISLHIGPIENAGGEWLWDVAKSPRLVIDTVSVSFRRPARRLGEERKSPDDFDQDSKAMVALAYTWRVLVNVFFVAVVLYVFDKLHGRTENITVAVLGLVYVTIRGIAIWHGIGLSNTIKIMDADFTRIRELLGDEQHARDRREAAKTGSKSLERERNKLIFIDGIFLSIISIICLLVLFNELGR